MAMDIASSLQAVVTDVSTGESEEGEGVRVDGHSVALQVLFDRLQEQFSPAGCSPWFPLIL